MTPGKEVREYAPGKSAPHYSRRALAGVILQAPILILALLVSLDSALVFNNYLGLVAGLTAHVAPPLSAIASIAGVIEIRKSRGALKGMLLAVTGSVLGGLETLSLIVIYVGMIFFLPMH